MNAKQLTLSALASSVVFGCLSILTWGGGRRWPAVFVFIAAISAVVVFIAGCVWMTAWLIAPLKRELK